MLQKIRDMGPLRNMLHLTALVFAALMPFARGSGYADGWGLFFNAILPATAPLVVIVIGLDIMMSAVWKAEADAARVSHFNGIIKAHLLVGGLLLAAWLAVFLPVLV